MTQIGRSFWTLCIALAALHFAHESFAGETDSIYWTKLGDSQAETGKYNDAAYSFTTALVKGDDTAELRAKRGWARYMQGSYKIALLDYDVAIKKAPTNAAYYNERGLIHHALEDFHSANVDYTKSLKLKAKDVAVLTNRAASYARLRILDKARRDLDRALSISADYVPANLEKAWLLVNDSRPKDIHLELRAIERLGPLDGPALEVRSRTQYSLGNWNAAIADADRAIALGDNADWHYTMRTWAKIQLGDYDGAIADASTHIARNGRSVSARSARAVAQQLAGRTDAAFADMEQAIHIYFAETYRTRTYLNVMAGRMKEALSDARKSVAHEPFSESSAIVLGFALLENNEPSAAIAECSRSLKIRETAGAYVCRARARLAVNERGTALLDARRALKLDGLSGNAYYVLGRIELIQGKVTSAIRNFEQASKLEMSNRAGLFMYRGDAEKARGNLTKARENYEKAKRFDVGRYTRELDKRLRALPAQQKSGP